MKYLDIPLEEFIKDKEYLKYEGPKKCLENGWDFSKAKPFITKYSYGLELDPEGLCSVHEPHDQESWQELF